VEKEKWRILPVSEVHDQPAALAGGHPEERAMGESIREVERAQEHELVPSAT
jgi:hypothetical protein